jgi:hypothetical protein
VVSRVSAAPAPASSLPVPAAWAMPDSSLWNRRPCQWLPAHIDCVCGTVRSSHDQLSLCQCLATRAAGRAYSAAHAWERCTHSLPNPQHTHRHNHHHRQESGACSSTARRTNTTNTASPALHTTHMFGTHQTSKKERPHNHHHHQQPPAATFVPIYTSTHNVARCRASFQTPAVTNAHQRLILGCPSMACLLLVTLGEICTAGGYLYLWKWEIWISLPACSQTAPLWLSWHWRLCQSQGPTPKAPCGALVAPGCTNDTQNCWPCEQRQCHLTTEAARPLPAPVLPVPCACVLSLRCPHLRLAKPTLHHCKTKPTQLVAHMHSTGLCTHAPHTAARALPRLQLAQAGSKTPAFLW